MAALRGDLSFAVWASSCHREAGRRGRKESVQGSQWKEESHFSPPTIHRLLTIFLFYF